MKSKIKYDKKQNLKVLLEKLKSISTIEEDNRVKFGDGFDLFELEWIFLSIIDFGSSTLSIELKKKILRNTFVRIALENDFDENNFCTHLDHNINIYNKRRPRTFVLLTTLSVQNLPFRKINIGGGTIRIHGKQFPKEFRNNRKEFLKSKNLAPDNEDYTKVTVTIDSKDPLDGYERANYCFEVFRSLLCLLLNSRVEFRFVDPKLEPINKIRQGEYSTVHLSNGEAAKKDIYWFVPDYKKAKTLVIKNQNKEKLNKSIRQLISNFNKCKKAHQNTLGKALYNFAEAFDESNKFVSFLRSWMVLEILTNSDQYDLLIKRTTSMYNTEQRAYQKQFLEALRLLRNEYVHKGHNGPDPIYACFKMQMFILNLLVLFNLKFAGFFDSIEEAVNFLDNYTPELDELKKKKRLLDKAFAEKIKNTKR